MLLNEIFDNWDGSKSPLSYQGTKKWRNEKDFFKKYFTLPYLTGKKKKKVSESKSSFDRYFFDSFPSLNGNVDVYKNIPPRMIESFKNQTRLKEIRGIVNNGDYYYWDASKALHYEVKNALEASHFLQDKFYRFTIYQNKIVSQSSLPMKYFEKLQELGFEIPVYLTESSSFNKYYLDTIGDTEVFLNMPSSLLKAFITSTSYGEVRGLIWRHLTAKGPEYSWIVWDAGNFFHHQMFHLLKDRNLINPQKYDIGSFTMINGTIEPGYDFFEEEQSRYITSLNMFEPFKKDFRIS